ncbi:transmembrane and death domain protein 1-like [Oncorhynchus nerka]|uniref:transmembrane and death domain protein 1-like n=1 Tax=Oncorhynchus nerka TaxID=8023 RepID=UPI0031B86DC5
MPVMGAPSLLFLLLLSPSLGEDTVAEDMGVHQLGRLVELLTSRECEDLLSALSHPEDNIFQQLDHLSLENNQLDLQKRVKRDTGTAANSEAQCRTALTDWLLKHGEQTYYDRLSRALQHIGRTDIAIEVGKNINQDKTLSMKKYVEEYHQRVNSIESPLVQSETEEHHVDPKPQARHVKELIWSDLELVVERAPVQQYQRRLLDGAWPLVYGVLLGFAGTFLMGVPVLLFLLYISRGDQRKLLCRSYKTRGPSSSSRGRYSRSRHKHMAGAGDVTSAEMAPLKPITSHGKVKGFNPGAAFPLSKSRQ